MLNLLANIAQCLLVVSSPLMDCGGLYFRRDVRIHKRTHFSYLYIYLSMFGWMKKSQETGKDVPVDTREWHELLPVIAVLLSFIFFSFTDCKRIL